MTSYSEYITRKVAGFGLTEDDINDICGEAGIDPRAAVDYTKAQLAMYESFHTLLTNTMCNVSEGGLSQSWNIEGIKLYYNQLCAKLGKANRLTPAPRIRNRSNIW